MKETWIRRDVTMPRGGRVVLLAIPVRRLVNGKLKPSTFHYEVGWWDPATRMFCTEADSYERENVSYWSAIQAPTSRVGTP